MANKKITALTPLTSAADGDFVPIVDVSDVSNTSTGETKKIKVSDLVGSKLGNIVEDTTPQLGGNLDVNGNSIVSVSNGNVTIAPDGSGQIVASGTELLVDEVTAPANPAANKGVIYAADAAGTTKLYFKDSAGTESDLTAGAQGGEVNQNAFSNIAVSGESTVSADSKTDTLNLVGSGVSITTNDTTDTVTFTVTGSGDVSKVGTPVDNQVGVWTGDGTIEGSTKFTFDGTSMYLQGATPIVLEGATDNAFETSLAVTDPTADRTITLPDSTGTVALVGHTHAAGDVTSGEFPTARIADNAITTAKINNDAVTYAKIQDVTATDKILGRVTAGAGDVEEISCTAAGRAILDDADALAQRATLGLVIGTDVEAYDADIAKINEADEWSAAQNFNSTSLTFDATQDWNLQTNQVCDLTLTANTTFDAPTNMKDGGFYSITIIQDGTGSRTAAWNAVFKWAGGTAPTLTTTASAKDIFVFRSDGTNMLEVGRQLDVK